MKNRSFDHIVKSKLENYSIEVDPNAWELFEQSQSDALFDQSIQNNLSDFQLEIYPKDWDVLEHKLEHEEVENGFDAIIGSKLAEVSLNELSDWDSFEKILENNDNFDNQIASKVRNHQVSMNNNHWPKLSEHLENIERQRRRIVITKFIEAAIFILFILSIMQLYPIHNIKKTNIYRTVAVNNDLQNSNNSQLNENIKEVNPSILTTQAAIDTKIALTNELVSSSKQSIILEDQISNSNILQNVNTDLVVEKFSKSNNGNFIDEALRFPITDKYVDDLSSIEWNDLEENLSDDLNFEGPINENDAFQHNLVLVSNTLKSMGISSLDYVRDEFSTPSPINKSKNKRGQLWVNTYGAADANFINTPYDNFYDSEGYQNDAYGYSLGASVSFETNNWELESGVEYSSLNYFPKAIIETTGSAFRGYTETTLKEIIFEMVEIPLNFKYKIFRKSGWSVYALSGLGMGAVLNGTYDINEESKAPLTSAKPGLTFSSQPDYTILDKKEFDEGLLNKGKLQNNIFFTLNTGIGITKKISESITFYAQPTYFHNLSVGGLGPNNDVHNRLTLQIGTKVKI